MLTSARRTLQFIFGASILTALSGVASAASLPAAQPLIHGVVSDAVTVPLMRDRPGALTRSFDEGVVNSNTRFAHVRLALARPANLQAALDTLAQAQTVKGSAYYHRWITPEQLRQYGPAQADVSRIATWLMSHGLTVNSISPSGMSIDFGGTAGQLAAAFHTQLHNVAYAGEAHISNVTAPAIPAALAPVVTGVTLANFFPKPAMRRVTRAVTIPTNPAYYAVGPADFATIYNVNPLRGSANFFGQPITGAGVSLAVVEQTQIKAADWNTFRQAAGLAQYKGTLTQINPAGCASPGFTGDEGEAALDTEWSTAVAPDAHIIEASCAGESPFEFGVLTSLTNLVEHDTPATIFSISYEGDEIQNGFGFQYEWTNLLEEGAAEGKAIFVAAGDNGVSADRNVVDADGLFVNGLADSAYNVSVGGTDFYDTALGQDAKYWRGHNGTGYSSAISYVPEIPWDNSCASSILAAYLGVSASAFCNSSLGNGPNAITQNGVGGSGSQSVYYKKPSWQLTSIPGVPNDGVRDQPDVSLFAANGIWQHFYIFCMSDTSQGGSPCNYYNLTDLFGNAAGGTSFGSPAFAGIAALIQQADQPVGRSPLAPPVPIGNPAPVLYAIAQGQFATPLAFSQCNSTLGNAIAKTCAFNIVTAGNNAEPCYAGTLSCTTSAPYAGGIGVLSAAVNGKTLTAYPAQQGYSLATGLGTVNVTNLVYSFSNYAL